MSLILWTFIILILVGYYTGIIFLIYGLVRNSFLKSGKLSKKLDKRMNFSLLGLLILIFLVLFYLMDYRTPTSRTLESISDVKLPSDFKVIKDEYHNMWQDYAIIYEIQFDTQASKEFIQSIKSSKFYNDKSFFKGAWEESDFILVDSIEAAWIKSPKGYLFNRSKERNEYYISFDTISNKLSYDECYD